MVKKNGEDWMDSLLGSVDKYVNLITHDGVERGGRASSFKLYSVVINGRKCDMVTEIELNGDPNDTVPLSRIAKLDIG